VKLPELPPPTGLGDIVLSWIPGTIDAVFSQDEKRCVVTQIAGNRSAFLVCDLQSGKIVFQKSYTDRLLSLPVEFGKDLFAYARNWFGFDVSRKEDERPMAATYLNARIDHIVATNDGYIVVGDRQGYVRAFRYVQRNR